MTEARVTAPPRLGQEEGRQLITEVKARAGKGGDVVIDLGNTQEMDSLGGACLVDTALIVKRRNGAFRIENARGPVAEFIEMIEPALHPPPPRPKPEDSTFVEIGGKALRYVGEVGEFLALCFDAFYWTIIAPFEGRGFRWGIFVDEVLEMGVRAVRIVFLMNFLLGLIIAMLSAAQARGFGITIYVADLVMIGFARELAAIMTAVVVSARTGAAIAAEIATMKVQEEIDAMRGMGLSTSQFLVAPKVLALSVSLPCLMTIGLVAGILGGCVWGVFVLGFPPSVWLDETLGAAHLSDLMQGYLKTLFFAIAIALIGCHNGFRVTGGSRGVGLMTTRAVVMDIFVMICIDIVFAAIFYYVLGR